VRFDDHERGFDLAVKDDTSASVESAIDCTHTFDGTLNFDVEHRLEKTWRSSELSCLENSASRRDDLSRASVDSISVELGIKDVEANTTERLFAKSTLSRSPDKTSREGVLELIHVLDSLSLINNDIGSSSEKIEDPNLLCIREIPVVSIDEGSARSNSLRGTTIFVEETKLLGV